MKEIPLTRGQFALVDDEDYEYLNQWKWYAFTGRETYYAVRQLTYYDNGKRKQKMIRMHRVIMNNPIGLDVDHIDHNGLNNCRYNLRSVTERENCLNRRRPNKTGYYGIFKDCNKYYSSIYKNGKKQRLGSFDTALEAHEAYKKAAGLPGFEKGSKEICRT